jgi:uncharacterized protein YndB with AHSA1/START domain
MKLDRSIVINRPPSVVFDLVAVKHQHNQTRWDPHMELQQLTDGPAGIGTRYRRRHTRIGAPIEGTMEVVEFEPGESMGFHILDQTPNGPLEVHSRSTLEPLDEGASTRMTIYLDIPAMEASMDPTMIEGSLRRMKELIEAET